MSFNTDHALETFKSLISISVELLRSLLLLNGGAIVALLAYIGQASNGAVVALGAVFRSPRRPSPRCVARARSPSAPSRSSPTPATDRSMPNKRRGSWGDDEHRAPLAARRRVGR
jgi:hypothetical protein